MIYIIGHEFVAGNTLPQKGGSIYKQRTQTMLNAKAASNSEFKPGQRYILYYIKNKFVEKQRKVVYTFLEFNTSNVVDLEFKNTLEADDYIARLSGETMQLNKQRAAIKQNS